MLAVQRSSGDSAALHYTSPRLRRDAKKDTVDLLNNFQNLTSKLLAAKREEALKLITELQNAKDAAKTAEKAAAQAIVEKDTEVLVKDSIIADLQRQILLLQGEGAFNTLQNT